MFHWDAGVPTVQISNVKHKKGFYDFCEPYVVGLPLVFLRRLMVRVTSTSVSRLGCRPSRRTARLRVLAREGRRMPLEEGVGQVTSARWPPAGQLNGGRQA